MDSIPLATPLPCRERPEALRPCLTASLLSFLAYLAKIESKWPQSVHKQWRPPTVSNQSLDVSNPRNEDALNEAQITRVNMGTVAKFTSQGEVPRRLSNESQCSAHDESDFSALRSRSVVGGPWGDGFP